MKVSECIKCGYCKRKTYSTTYKPAGYHRIGVTHAYHFCELFNKRCLDVKKCSEKGRL